MTMKQGETHTPGPWRLGDFSDTGGYDCMTCGISAGPASLDGAYYGQGHCEEPSPNLRARMMADARLIAAAPDLLTACEEVLAWYEDQIYDGKPDPACIGEVRAAIKKARGG